MSKKNHEALADHRGNPNVPIPPVLEVVQVEVPTVTVLVDHACDGVAVRVGLDHARPMYSRSSIPLRVEKSDLRAVLYAGFLNPQISYTEYLHDTDFVNNTLFEILAFKDSRFFDVPRIQPLASLTHKLIRLLSIKKYTRYEIKKKGIWRRRRSELSAPPGTKCPRTQEPGRSRVSEGPSSATR